MVNGFEFGDIVKQGIAGGQAAEQQRAQQDAALAQLIKGKGLDQQNEMAKLAQQHANTMDQFKVAHDTTVSDAGKGIKATNKLGGATTSINETDPGAKSASQASGFLKTAQAAYKPINEQLDASIGTLDALDHKNSTSDKLALINEARLAAGAGGSRAIKSMVDTLSGGKTSAGSFQDAVNWLNNTPEIPSMTDAMRDSIRESVHNRLSQIEQQHRNASDSLSQQGAIVAPNVNYQGLIGSLSGPAQQKLAQLQQRRDEYTKQRAAMAPARNVSNPTVADPNTSTLDKLGSFVSNLMRSKKAAAPQEDAPPPGMKVQVNTKTGQKRFVPIGG